MDWLYEYDEERHMQMERKEWREIGREEGLKEGKLEAKQEIIKNSLKIGLSPEIVASISKISVQQILEIERNMKKK